VRKLVAALAFACATMLPATAQTVQERLPTCLACHGENGQSQNPDVRGILLNSSAAC
jgi:cytochrome c553